MTKRQLDDRLSDARARSSASARCSGASPTTSGMGRTVLQRVVLRFQRVMRELAASRVKLARAGLLAGRADQSHLSRETRRLAGLTPRQR
jgi:hypothetical protein